MRLLEIPNQEEEIKILERASYEVSCRQNIINFLIKDGIDLNDKKYKNYWDEYILYTIAYDQLKQNFQENQILKAMGQDFTGNWEVDFQKRVIKIYD